MITVLITTYNCKKYLASAVKSVLRQKYAFYELLIVDDGSIDGTAELVSAFSDPRIRYLCKEHKGRTAALNYGLAAAKYDWIALLDSDDMMTSGKLQRFAAFINGPINQVITTWVSVFTGNRIVYQLKYPSDHRALQLFLMVHGFNNSVLFNRKFILEKGGYKEVERAEDYELWLRIIPDAKFYCIPEFLSFHRYSNDSYSALNFQTTKKAIRNIQKRYPGYLEELVTEAAERNDILLRREYFFGESILSFPSGGLSIKYLLLFILSLFPLSFNNNLKLINVTGRINYFYHYFSKVNKNLRGEIKYVSGERNKVKVYKRRRSVQPAR